MAQASGLAHEQWKIKHTGALDNNEKSATPFRMQPDAQRLTSHDNPVMVRCLDMTDMIQRYPNQLFLQLLKNDNVIFVNIE